MKRGAIRAILMFGKTVTGKDTQQCPPQIPRRRAGADSNCYLSLSANEPGALPPDQTGSPHRYMWAKTPKHWFTTSFFHPLPLLVTLQVCQDRQQTESFSGSADTKLVTTPTTQSTSGHLSPHNAYVSAQDAKITETETKLFFLFLFTPGTNRDGTFSSLFFFFTPGKLVLQLFTNFMEGRCCQHETYSLDNCGRQLHGDEERNQLRQSLDGGCQNARLGVCHATCTQAWIHAVHNSCANASRRNYSDTDQGVAIMIFMQPSCASWFSVTTWGAASVLWWCALTNQILPLPNKHGTDSSPPPQKIKTVRNGHLL